MKQDDPCSPESNLADLAYQIAHEFNNVLNTILLQLAVLEQRGLDAESRYEVGAVRRLGKGAAQMIRRWQQYMGRQHPPPTVVDLNRVIRDIAGDKVRLTLAEDLPPVRVSEPDLKRLLTLLIGQGRLATGNAGEILVASERGNGHVLVRVEDSGPTTDEEQLTSLFEPFAVTRPGSEGWELAVCRAVARRLDGSLRAHNRPQGGMAFTVELSPAAV